MALNRSGKSRHHCLAPDLKGKIFSLLLLIMILTVGFVGVHPLCQVKKVFFYSWFAERFLKS